MKHIPLLGEMTLKKTVAIEVILIATAFAVFAPGGQDLRGQYIFVAQGCIECGYTPYHASLILAPLGIIPPEIVWPVWTLATLAGLAWLCSRMGVEPAYALLAFPTLASVWLGQIDIVIALGLFLALTSPNPYVRGVGLLLASIKPQVAGPAILLLWLRDDSRLKLLVAPMIVFAVSLLIWGWDWPLRWFSYITQNPRVDTWVSTLYPVGLLAFLAVPFFREKRAQLTMTLLATALSVPRFYSYSHLVFLPLFAPWWVLPLSYAWLALAPL